VHLLIAKITHGLSIVAKIPVLAAMCCIVITMLFAIWDLMRLLWDEIHTANPHLWTVSVAKALYFFSHTLTIVVGYERLKSVKPMISSPRIPLSDITKIAGIALLRQVPTANYHAFEAERLAAMSAALLSLAVAGWLFVKTSSLTRQSADPDVDGVTDAEAL
jgi:uncharacterized membrane protein (DUF373 family)